MVLDFTHIYSFLSESNYIIYPSFSSTDIVLINHFSRIAFIVTMIQLSHVRGHITYLFSIISLLFFDFFYLFINFVVYCYIFSNFSPSFLLFHLPTTININITLPLCIDLPFIWTILINILLL